jgi:hypothetical protein
MEPETVVQRFNVDAYLSRFTLFFADDTEAFVDELVSLCYTQSFDALSAAQLRRAVGLYQETAMLKSTCRGSTKIARDGRLRNLSHIRSKLCLFADFYCADALANLLAGRELEPDIRAALRELVVYRHDGKSGKALAANLYGDFKHSCADESDLLMYLADYPPTLGNSGPGEFSLEWPEFALDQCADQYYISEYALGVDGVWACTGQEEPMPSKAQAFEALKLMVRKYYGGK